MSRKTRKLMWSVPLIAAVAVIGALAAFMAVVPGALFADSLPGAATDLTAKADGRTAIDLDWTAPTDGGSLDGYRIDRSTNGHTWFAHKGKTMADLIRVANYKDTGLDPGKDYIYRVFAVNSHGAGPTSDDAGATTKAVEAPGLVRNLQATDRASSTKIVVTWQAPTDNGGEPITEYYVNYKTENGSWPSPLTTVDIDDSDMNGVAKVSVTTDVCATNGGQTSNDTITWTHTSLLANVEYSYRVYATNGMDQTASDTEVGSTGNPVMPSPVTGLSVQKVVAADMVQLYWIDPASNGGQDVDRYLLHISKTNRHWPTFTAVLSTDIAEALGNEATNTVAVEITVADAADNVYQDSHSIPNGATGTWYYRVYTETKDAISDTEGTTDMPLRSVRASGSVNFAAILPQAPTNPMAVAATYTKIDVTWTATEWDSITGLTAIVPGIDRRLSPTGYRIDVSEDGMTWIKILEDNTNLALPEFSHATGVERGEMYRYRVFPIFSSRLGPAVRTIDPGVGPAAATAPGNVRSLAASESGAGQIVVTWQKPEDDGGSPITGYLLQTSTDQITWTDKKSLLACVLSYTDKGLAAETTLYYRVIAFNSVNAGNPVATAPVNLVERSAKTTGADLPPAPVGLTVEAAKDSTIQSHGDRGILVYWNAADDPDGAPIENYRVERRVKPDTASPWGEWEWVQTCLATAGTLLYTHCTDPAEPDYDGGEERMYKVAAQNAAGIGTFSDAVNVPRPAADHTHNASPMAVGTIAAQTVSAGESVTVDVAANFSDADMGDTLTYTAMSDMEMYATADIPADSSMLTITGVAAGTATVMVTATDPDGASVMQTIMVTVEAADTTLGDASDLTAIPNADGSIALEWTPAPNATHNFVYGTDGTNSVAWAYAMVDDMHTVPAVDLTDGKSYTFYVIAGQWTEVTEGTWEGEWAPGGWTGPAMTTAMAAAVSN